MRKIPTHPPGGDGGRRSSKYNRSQTREKDNFLRLLHKLCQTVVGELPAIRRPRLPLRDVLFCLIYKVYVNSNSRNLEYDLEHLQKEGFISRVPHFNSLPNYMRNTGITPYLDRFVGVSALALRDVETDFAVDSTKLLQPRCYDRVDPKTKRKSRPPDRVKLHLLCGTETRVVAAARVSSVFDSDPQHFGPLFERALDLGFNIQIIRADKGYWSPARLCYIRGRGVVPVITPKQRGRRKKAPAAGQADEGRRRNQVETVNFMIAAKFGKKLRSVSRVGQVNEALCKVICHNLRVLNLEAHQRGMEVRFP
jgi:hypothetical protein